jgi:hypothetical protein
MGIFTKHLISLYKDNESDRFWRICHSLPPAFSMSRRQESLSNVGREGLWDAPRLFAKWEFGRKNGRITSFSIIENLSLKVN